MLERGESSIVFEFAGMGVNPGFESVDEDATGDGGIGPLQDVEDIGCGELARGETFPEPILDISEKVGVRRIGIH